LIVITFPACFCKYPSERYPFQLVFRTRLSYAKQQLIRTEYTLMAFEEQALDERKDFKNVKENHVTIIPGKNQMVFWQGCNVTVIEKDSEGREHYRPLTGMPNGQGRIELGTKLYITDGKVIAERGIM